MERRACSRDRLRLRFGPPLHLLPDPQLSLRIVQRPMGRRRHAGSLGGRRDDAVHPFLGHMVGHPGRCKRCAGRRDTRLRNTAQPQRMPRESGRSQQQTQPVPVPRWRRGKQIVTGQHRHHVGGDLVVRRPLAQQTVLRNAMHPFGVGAPLLPPRGRSDQGTVGASLLRRAADFNGKSAFSQAARLEIKEDDQGPATLLKHVPTWAFNACIASACHRIEP